MRRLFLSGTALMLAATGSAAAAPCTGDMDATLGVVTRYSSGSFMSVTERIARDGPLAIQQLLWRDHGFEDGAVQHRFDVIYGFLPVGELKDFMRDGASSPATANDRPAMDAALLRGIRKDLGRSHPDFVAAMDEMWRAPAPSATVSYAGNNLQATVSIVAEERIGNFPDADGMTDTIVIETASNRGARQKTWFSTEHCQIVRHEFDGNGDTNQAVSTDVPPVKANARRQGRAATPEAFVVELNGAINTLDTGAIVRLIHPDWLAALKETFEAAYRQGKQRKINLLLGADLDMGALTAMSGAEIYRMQLSNAMGRTELPVIFMGMSMDLISAARNGKDAAGIVVRTDFPKDGRILSETASLKLAKTDAAGWVLVPDEGRRDTFFAGLGVRLP